MKKALFATLALAAALTAQAVQVELLTNGEGTTRDGWSSISSGLGSFESEVDNDGVYWFKSSYGHCSLQQTVELAPLGMTAEYINGRPAVTVSGLIKAQWGSTVCNVKVYELDESNTIVATHTIVDRAGETIPEETAYSGGFALAPNTAKLRYELNGQDKSNWSGHYGPWFRHCSLAIDKPLALSCVSAGAALAGSDDAPPIAPRKGDDIFQGYYTEDGVQVYDENYAFVLDGRSVFALPENTTLYAQWQPVARKPEGGFTRLVYRGVLTNFGEWASGLKKTMIVKVYDSASSATPLWSGEVADVPINPDGSFEAVFGNDELAYAFASNDVTHVELTVGDALSPLAPRRSFASVASVNRALVAEGAASDIKIGTLGANALVAEKVVAGSLEASETVRVEGSVSVEVKPFDIERGRETTIWRGAGVTAWGDSACVATTNGVVAGQLLWTADREGVAMVHATGKTRSTLRIPATIQFVRPGDEVRAPTWENGEVSVTVWGYRK